MVIMNRTSVRGIIHDEHQEIVYLLKKQEKINWNLFDIDQNRD